jgi:hypothetical protein
LPRVAVALITLANDSEKGRPGVGTPAQCPANQSIVIAIVGLVPHPRCPPLPLVIQRVT